MENMGGGWTWECMNELCFDLFGRIWDFNCIIQHSPPCTDSTECSNLSLNFASMDIINVHVTVDICLGA